MGKDSTCQALIVCIGIIGLIFLFCLYLRLFLKCYIPLYMGKEPVPGCKTQPLPPPGMVGSGSGGYDETQAIFWMTIFMIMFIAGLGICIIYISNSLRKKTEAEKDDRSFLRCCMVLMILWFLLALLATILFLKSTDAWDLPMAHYVRVILILIVCGVILLVGYNCSKNRPGHQPINQDEIEKRTTPQIQGEGMTDSATVVPCTGVDVSIDYHCPHH